MKKYKVKASGNVVQVKIIINGSSHHRVIPVLAFSEKNAQLLLDAVDKLERINNNVKSIIR